MAQILKHPTLAAYAGCDAVVQLAPDRADTPIKMLQITDMQFIDSAQMRFPTRLCRDEYLAWLPEKFDAVCADHIRALVAQTQPDVIFITGDMVYGSFDDSGRTFMRYCELMDSFGIPWAPVFGNHDNETALGVTWQCEMLESRPWCLFSRGSVTGNGNYTVGVAVGEQLVRVLYMTDSNGCGDTTDPEVMRHQGIFPDQMARIRESAEKIRAAQGQTVPAIMAFHIPIVEFRTAELAKGYATEERPRYVLAVDVPAKQGDFGCRLERFHPIATPEDFMRFAKDCGIDEVCAGHCHNNNSSIVYEGVRFTFGLKTGQYDYHIPGLLGGTLHTQLRGDLCVMHVPSTVMYAPYKPTAPALNRIIEKE